MRSLTIATFIVFSLQTAAVGQQDSVGQISPGAAGLSSERLEAATDLLSSFVRDGKIAGAVAAVARNGQLGYLQAVGYQDLDDRTPMTDRSLFRIYSMTKAITSTAVMMLHEEGRFELSDPVSDYLPEFGEVRVLASPSGETRPPARPMTVQDLLLHTSGLNHRTSELYSQHQVRSREDDLPTFISKIARTPLMEDPGTRFRYSEAPTVLGRLVEVWSAQPFESFLESRIFRPLGMLDTSFWVGPDQVPRLTTVYRSQDGLLTPFQIEEVPFTEEGALREGAVGLISTAPDYLRFARMLLNGGELEGNRILEASTVEMMTRNGLSDEVLASRGGATGWSLGNLSVVLDPPGLNYPANEGEYGWEGSGGTIFWNDPMNDLTIVLMTQNLPSNPDSLRQRFKALVEQAIVD